MKFSSQEEYGLRCLIQLAQAQPIALKGNDGLSIGSLTIPEISKLESLPSTNVAKLLMILRKGGLVTSTRGQTGGYLLAKPANEIKISEVLTVLGGKLYDQDFCSRHSGSSPICTHDVDCSVRGLWQLLQSAVDSVADRLTLADIAGVPRVVTRRFDSLAHLNYVLKDQTPNSIGAKSEQISHENS